MKNNEWMKKIQMTFVPVSNSEHAILIQQSNILLIDQIDM